MNKKIVSLVCFILFVIGLIVGAYTHELDIAKNIYATGSAGSAAWTNIGEKVFNGDI